MQGEFLIKCNKVSTEATVCVTMKQAMKTYANRVDSVQDNLRSGQYSSVKKTLGIIEENVRDNAKALGRLGNKLEDIVQKYSNAENDILGIKVTRDSKEDSNVGDVLDIIYGVLESGNLSASSIPYLKMLLSGVTGEEIDASIIASVLNSNINLFAFFADVAENGWKKALKNGFGFSTYMPDGTVAGKKFAEYLKIAVKKETDDFIGATDDLVKTSGAVAKWAGNILTGITNGVENYQEYKSGKISGGRAWAETGIETAVDIAIGAGATVVTGAAIAAAGVTAAPAIVVAGGAALVVAGVNWISETITGKDIGEVVADGVCNIGKSFASWLGF